MDSMSEAMRESDNALVLAGFEDLLKARVERGEDFMAFEYKFLRDAILDRMNNKA